MQPDTDPFRYCVHCGADCYEDEPEHGPGCPRVTGLWPVTERELQPAGIVCMDCGDEFKVRDVYAHRQTEQDDVFEIVCVGCRVLNPEALDV